MTSAFASFLAATAPPRRARRRWLLLLSGGAHAGLLVAVAVVTTRTPAPAPTREPLLLTLVAPRAPARSRPPAPAAAPRRPKRAPRRQLTQPVLTPPPPAPPEPEPEPDSGSAADDPAEPGPPAATSALGVAGGDPYLPLELREVSRPPAVLTQVTPLYPPEARRARIEGRVVLLVVVGVDGIVEPPLTRVMRSIPALDAAAIAAIEKWRFSPALDRSGRPARVVLEVPFQFFLR